MSWELRDLDVEFPRALYGPDPIYESDQVGFNAAWVRVGVDEVFKLSRLGSGRVGSGGVQTITEVL